MLIMPSPNPADLDTIRDILYQVTMNELIIDPDDPHFW